MSDSYERTDKIISFSIDENDMVFVRDYRRSIDSRPLPRENGRGQMDARSFVREFKDPKFQKKYSKIKTTGVDSHHIKYYGIPKRASRAEYEGSAWEIIIDTASPSYEQTKNTLNEAKYQVNIANNPNSKQNKIKDVKTTAALIALSAAFLAGTYTLYDYTYNGKLGMWEAFKNHLQNNNKASSTIDSEFKTSEDSLNDLLSSSETNTDSISSGKGR